ncbi:N-acetylneuraminate lyase-like isoform X2 [Toxorhynchites rutilus septentrionalis]|uniref:N-acetylneuraminate lyase-like isoform X2 n=1 Tax=Toxorhynchites rutilus septentrionalis TaxID=329112 RepID=UPI0024796116|nr:N-acetylneuraminate lyase-like isoform X2 [Toxorhynchites rutilus septentrionalis]
MNRRDLTINYDIIHPYAKHLKSNGVHAVLINGTTGEGMLLNVEERKRTAEIWKQACKENEIVMMVQVGGAPYPDVVELTKHAENLDVDGILCLPELYFKPKSPEALTNYLGSIASHCPTTPFFYYHIPMFTDVNIHMPTFLDMAEKTIPNLHGIKYTSGDLDQGTNCLKTERTIFLGADTILCGAVATGFDSFIMTTLNICPEISQNIIDLLKCGRVEESRDKQRDLNSTICDILEHGDWVSAMKKAFNEHCHLSLGKTRPPLNLKSDAD